MFELPELTPEYFEIRWVGRLRKVGLEVSPLSLHRRPTQVHAEPGYLLELKGVVSRADWQRRALIGCRQQDALIGRAEIESFREHLTEARVEAGILFATAPFALEALHAAHDCALALLRVTDGRTAFDTSGWGTPGHYPAWLPAYCAQLVGRDIAGQPQYRLLEAGQADLITGPWRTVEDGGGRG